MEQDHSRRSKDAESAAAAYLPGPRKPVLIQTWNTELGDDGAKELGEWSTRKESRLISLNVCKNAIKVRLLQYH